MTSVADFDKWLRRKDRDPCWLLEIDYVKEVAGAPVTATLYLCKSTTGSYVSHATDTPANTPYLDKLTSLPWITREIDRTTLMGGASSTFGEGKLNDTNRLLDPILGYAYDGSECRLYFGDRSWAKADFVSIYAAIGDSMSGEGTEITYKIKDASALLDKRIGGDELIGGTGANANQSRPLPLGACRNVPLVLKSLVPLTYVYGVSSFGAGGQILAALREGGNDISGSWGDNGDGTTNLTASPTLQLTGDVLRTRYAPGGDTYRGSDFFQMLAGDAMGGGLISLGRYTGAHSSYGDRDSQDFHLQVYLTEGRNIRDILNADVCPSLNAFYAFDQSNSFYYGRIFPYNPSGASVMDFVEDDLIAEIKPTIDHLAPLYDRIFCLGDKNQTPQSNLATFISADLRSRYESKGLTYSQPARTGTSYNDNPRLYHKTMSDSPLIETNIAVNFDSDSIASDELATFADIREKRSRPLVRHFDAAYRFRAYRVKLGDVVTMTLDRFQLDSGPRAQVTKVHIDPDNERVELTLTYRFGAAGPSGGAAADDVWLMEDGVTEIDQEDGSTIIHSV